MVRRNAYLSPGQRKLSRYLHTQSCIRVAGYAPGREYEEQQVRCRIMAVIALLCFSAGLAALFI